MAPSGAWAAGGWRAQVVILIGEVCCCMFSTARARDALCGVASGPTQYMEDFFKVLPRRFSITLASAASPRASRPSGAGGPFKSRDTEHRGTV